jgi:hypothetical protein
MSAFAKYPRAWCADLCGRRIRLTIWHRAHGHVCVGCYVRAFNRAEQDDERRQLRGLTPEELERI